MSGLDGPLAGLRLIVARSAGSVEASAAHFAALGARVQAVATSEITTATDGGAALRTALGAGPGRLVVASVAGLDAAVAAGARPAAWTVAAVGPTTARRARDAGFSVVVEAEPSTAAVLVGALAELEPTREVAPVVENQPSALVAAVEAAGAARRIECVPAYRNTARRPDLEVATLAAAHLVAVFSPSAVRSIAEIGPASRVLAIGPTTASAAVAWLGFERVLVAEPHDLDGMALAAQRWWAERRHDVGSRP